jgi:hypothetical protein
MKSLNRKEFKISGVKLFLEDLDNIIEIIRSDSKGIEIFDKDFKYDSIADLVNNKKKRVKSLNLVGYDPYISFEYKSPTFFSQDLDFAGEIKLSTFRDADSAFFKIKELLGQKKRWFSILLTHQWLILFLSGISAINILYYLIFPTKFPTEIGMTAALLVLSFFLIPIFYCLLFLGILGYLTSINLVYSHKGLPLWVRRKDDLSINLIFVLINGITGAIIALILGKIL